ncbi:MAG: hypothetical protein ACFFCW_23535 [Candidatus Hodarchaeota archaeon]
MRSWILNKRSLALVLFLFIAAPTSYLALKVYQYNTYIWMPDYFLNSQANKIDNIRNGHVLFLIADHHEPGRGERGSRISRAWCEGYKSNIEGIYDDFGKPVQYTWFYPYDHLNLGVIFNLNELVFEGLGEVEFQWHHGPDTNETFPPKLAKAVSWFNSHGCMLPVGLNPKPQFGFVHGNSALDNSDGNPNHCGVNRELDILKQCGCYADLTFSVLGTLAQPAKVNSIYYAKDTDEPKSYNNGVDVKVGSSNSGLMIFEGPICCDWHDRIWDCAALETTSPIKPHRIKLWLKFAPIVKGRPEWLFVKVHAHGVQSKSLILSQQFRGMFFQLKKVCKDKGLSLHFITAREAFNIVKAAEKGLKGNPEAYRDYLLRKPINRVMTVPCRIKNVVVSEARIDFELFEPKNMGFSFKIGPVRSIKGFLKRYRGEVTESGRYLITLEGDGIVEICSKEPVEFKNEVISCATNEFEEYVYRVDCNS